MRFIKLLIFLFLITLGAAFAVKNAGSVNLDFYFGKSDLPLSLLLVGALSVGALLGVLAASGTLLRLKRENAVLRRKAKMVSEEVKNLRTMPLKE